MKKKLYKGIYCFLLFGMMAAFLSLSGCKDNAETTAPPVIMEVRNYDASPNDTVVQTLEASQWVVLTGKNLDNVKFIFFGTTQASLNSTLVTGQNMVVQVPGIPFQSVPRDKVNEITLVDKNGVTTTYPINITGAPLISYVRNYEAAPNDTLLTAVALGQHINLIGYNLKGATKIAFAGLEIDLAGVVYTDTSVVVTVPADLTGADASKANKITYTTEIGTSTFSIPIFDPALLALYSNEMYQLLAGGLNKEKTWVLDFNADGVSKHFPGPIWFSGEDLRYGSPGSYGCGSGGNCWSWEPTWQGWMPPAADYGTMTFKLKGAPIIPTVTVNQKALDPNNTTKNGTFTGGYFMDIDAKTITFSDVIPLNMGWNNVDWSKAYIITLTADGMQLGFHHKSKTELELYSFIPK